MPYKPQLVTFFDILGFRNLVETAKPNLIEGILQKIRQRTTPDAELRKLYEIGVIAFSDSIVRAVNIKSKSNIIHPSGILYYELFDLAFIQSGLIFEDGVFLRGAITADNLHLKGKTVFGPGLVRAYEIESKEAVYPRILVDDKLMELAKKAKQFLGASHHEPMTDMTCIERLTRVDADGKRFINYLEVARYDTDGDLELLNVLDKHYERIAEKSLENCSNDRVMEKFRWAASYHNAVVNKYSKAFFENNGCSKQKFLLTEQQVPGLSGWKIGAGKAESVKPRS